jgi:hypothetical protein
MGRLTDERMGLLICSSRFYWPVFKFKFNLSYDQHSVCQSVLVSGHHVGTTTNFSFSLRTLSSNISFLLVWGTLPDDRRCLKLTCTSATGPRQHCHSVQVPQNVRPCLTAAFETEFLSVSSYDSQLYNGGILTRIHAEVRVVVKSKSKLSYDRRSVGQSILVSDHYLGHQPIFL